MSLATSSWVAWSGESIRTGAATTERLSEWRVRIEAIPSASMTPLKPTRSLIVRCGVSCSMIATSPLLTSRSTRHTERPAAARQTPRLVATRLLPTPPLVENTVRTLPRGASASAWATAAAWAISAAAWARANSAAAWASSMIVWPIALATLRARWTAVVMPARSRAATTSRMPLRRARESAALSTS